MEDIPTQTHVQLHLTDDARASHLDALSCEDKVCAIRDRGSYLSATQGRHVIPLEPKEKRPVGNAVANFWARRPEAIHVDGKAFYSRFMQGHLHTIINSGKPLTLHLLEGEDNCFVRRHFAELSKQIEADVPSHTLEVTLARKIYNPDLKEAIEQTLGASSEDKTPYALSMSVVVHEANLNWLPAVWAWQNRGGHRSVLPLGHVDPELAKHCAVAGFSSFATGPQHRAFIKAAHEMGARGRQENLHVVVTRHGLIIASETARSTTYTDGIEQAVRVIMQRDLSNHEMLFALSEMDRLANIVLHSNLHHLAGTDIKPREIALSLPE